MMNRLNVAIADDNERVIQSLSEVIEKDEHMHLIGKSTNGKDFYELIKQKQPDVVLVDINPEECRVPRPRKKGIL